MKTRCKQVNYLDISANQVDCEQRTFILYSHQNWFIMSSTSTPHQNLAMPHPWGARPTLRTTEPIQTLVIKASVFAKTEGQAL